MRGDLFYFLYGMYKFVMPIAVFIGLIALVIFGIHNFPEVTLRLISVFCIIFLGGFFCLLFASAMISLGKKEYRKRHKL